MSNGDKAKTDNSHLGQKIHVRLESLKCFQNQQSISVLNCYHGYNIIWKSIIKKTNISLNVTGIDKKKDLPGVYLQGDNIRFLRSLNLSRYHIIDLDAYGIPYYQLKEIIKKRWHGVIHITANQVTFVTLPYELLEEIGITKNMIEPVPSMYRSFALTPLLHIIAKRWGSKKARGYFLGNYNYFWVDTR